MTKLLLTLATLIAFATPRIQAEDLYDYRTPRESQDWCTISIRTKPANGPDLPLVLLIGDSITVRYASEVGAALKDKAYVSLLGTSKAVGDPALLDEIKLVLRQNVYAVIHFNYGLHGGIEGYRKGFADVLATLQRYAPSAKLVWATTTPCQQKDDTPDKGVIARNQIAAAHIAKAGLVVDDLYTLVANHPKKLWDGGGVHYTAEGTALQSKQVAQVIAPLLPVPVKPLRVLMIGNSQCPLMVGNKLIENLAASDPGAPPIQITGCIKGGASLRSHWEAGTATNTARGMIASGAWDYVVLQDIYNVQAPAFQPYARQFHEFIQGKGAKTLLFGTASILSDYPACFERQHRLHLDMARELKAALVDASPAYTKYFGPQPSAERMESLFAKDKMHPDLWGSYIYA
ncbi:MAG: SGNH/GDSL hydrolase family protein, partial [Verrucomicrobia bacterium]|nr:SGNH/GDSL hydrolase family protein [Verrucomicrobiota bacterium]